MSTRSRRYRLPLAIVVAGFSLERGRLACPGQPVGFATLLWS